MLRLKAAVSAVADFTGGSFVPVLADPGPGLDGADPAQVSRILLCSGKVYYDLAEQRRAEQRRDVAIIRVERLYPLPVTELTQALAAYPNATDLTWVQEEPVNMGAWPYLAMHLPGLGHRLNVVALPESSAPASGSAKRHARDHAALVTSALG
jgi:2-oxoglutarate decarboxylase